jgi:hypothetical protein
VSAESPSSPAPRSTLVVDSGGAPRDDVDDMLDALAKDLDMDIVRAPIVACEKCQHFSCVCQVLADHVLGCHYRLAVTCAIPIACEKHGRDVCAECGDVCTCEEIKIQKGVKNP